MRERQTARHQRTPGEWVRRGLLAAVAMAVGGVSIAHTLALVTVRRNPQLAYALAPNDGRITAALADRRLTDSEARDPEAVALARKALRQDATAVPAVVVLGLNAQIRSDGEQAHRLLTYAQTLSRRNVKSLLWAIEDAAARGDTRGAMRSYDIALRVSRPMVDVLFPILATAISDAEVLREFNRVLVGRPAWAPLFIEYIASNGPDPRAGAQVLRTASQQGQPVSGLARALMTERLVSQGMPEEAWRFYASFRTNARSDTVRDPEFSANLNTPTVFDWQSVATNGLVATIEPGFISFSAPSSASGALVQQLQMLPVGTYRLYGQSSGIEQTGDGLAYWQMVCRDGERELGRINVPASDQASGRFSGTITVPSNCPVQILRLATSPSNAVSGVSGEIQRLRVEAVAASRGAGR